LIVFLLRLCRKGVGEAVQGDGDWEDREAVRREAASSLQEERQAQEEALQDGKQMLFQFTRVFFS
jgi:hypothetical protein